MFYSKELLEKTIKVWESYSSNALSLDDAEEITKNMVELLSFLESLAEKYAKSATSIAAKKDQPCSAK